MKPIKVAYNGPRYMSPVIEPIKPIQYVEINAKAFITAIRMDIAMALC